MRLKNWEVGLLIVAAISLAIFGLARTVGMRASSRDGIVTRIARPGVAFWPEPVDVELRIDASELPDCAAGVDLTPVYVAMVLDHSGSMAGAPLAEARNAAIDFADLMNLAEEGDAVAVIGFDDIAYLMTGLSYNRNQVVQAIQRIAEGGGTNIAAGLDMATQQFSNTQIPVDAQQVIILLSDGQSDANAAIAVANQAKAKNIRVVTVAMGDADRTTLAQIASSEADYYEITDATALLDIYEEIAAGIVGTIATDLTLQEFYNDEDFDMSGGIYRAQQTGNQINWQIPFVGQRGRSVGYVLQPLALGLPRVSPAPGQMSLVTCEGQLVSQPTSDGPRVLVLFPVWLLFIFPALALFWLLIRLIQALRPVPRKAVGPPPMHKGIPEQTQQPEKKPMKQGADVTHGRLSSSRLSGGPTTPPPPPPPNKDE